MPAFTNKFAGKRVVVVGGTSGIGRSVAHGVLEFGGEVIIAGSSQESVDRAIKKLEADADAKGRITGHVLDLNAGSLQDMDKSIESFLTKVGKIDHFTHTSGDKLYLASIEDIDLDKAVQAYRVRHLAALAAVKAIKKHDLIREGGSIVLTSGGAFEKPILQWTVAGGLLGATVVASKNIALEMAPKVRCNVVLPGPVSTEMWNSHTDDVEGMMKEYAKSCLTPTVADPTDTAEAYLYCMRDGSLTGAEIVNDCGNRYK